MKNIYRRDGRSVKIRVLLVSVVNVALVAITLGRMIGIAVSRRGLSK